MSEPITHDQTQAVARLTAKERECLTRWLGHATAKEIALDLGITHHAVEKRLKSARQKLGAATSLEAARILADAQDYGRTVCGAPDLATEAIALDTPGHVAARPGIAGVLRHPLTIPGVAIMSILIAAIALAASGQTGDAPAASDIQTNVAATYLRAGDDPGEAIAGSFDRLDRDGSGFIEKPEMALTRFAMVEKRDTDATPAPSARMARIEGADADGDERVSREEYAGWMKDLIARAASRSD